MIIIGAKGFAKELLEVCHQLGRTENLVFFDNVSPDLPELLFGQFPIIRSEDEVKAHFNTHSNDFALGLGNPKLREQMCLLFESWGGKPNSLISPKATLGNFNNTIEEGVCIMTGTVLTNDIWVEKGVLINLNCTLGHDVNVGAFSEICPGVHLSGHVKIGKNCFLGTGAVILPGITLGSGTVVAAGSVVTSNVPPNCLVAGVPAQIKKRL